MSLVDRIVSSMRGGAPSTAGLRNAADSFAMNRRLQDSQDRVEATNGSLKEAAMRGDPIAIKAYREQGGLFGVGINPQDSLNTINKLQGLGNSYQANELEKRIMSGDTAGVNATTGLNIHALENGDYVIGNDATGMRFKTPQEALQYGSSSISPDYSKTRLGESIRRSREQNTLDDKREDAEDAFKKQKELLYLQNSFKQDGSAEALFKQNEARGELYAKLIKEGMNEEDAANQVNLYLPLGKTESNTVGLPDNNETTVQIQQTPTSNFDLGFGEENDVIKDVFAKNPKAAAEIKKIVEISKMSGASSEQIQRYMKNAAERLVEEKRNADISEQVSDDFAKYGFGGNPNMTRIGDISGMFVPNKTDRTNATKRELGLF